MERTLPNPLIWVRAIHFTATVMMVGAVFFLTLVAEPAFRVAGQNKHISAVVRHLLAWIAWCSFGLVVASGAAWPLLLAQRMTDAPLPAVLMDGAVWTVLTQTDFGQVWIARFVLAALFAGALYSYQTTQSTNANRMGLLTGLLAASLVGALALAGHAAAGSDSGGTVHLLSDMLHLIAAAAWVGALIPLAVLLSAALREHDVAAVAIAREATLRFSTLGIASVATLVATGIVNSWVLAGSVHAMVATDYGRLLLLKIAVFFLMLSVAAINRLRLTPSLVQANDPPAALLALRTLRKNSMIEATLGAIILLIVAVLGTLEPGLQEQEPV